VGGGVRQSRYWENEVICIVTRKRLTGLDVAPTKGKSQEKPPPTATAPGYNPNELHREAKQW